MFIPCRLRYRDGENVKDLFGVGIKKSPGQQRFSVLLAEDEKVRCCAQGADGESGSSPTCPLDASSRHRRGGASPGACAQPGDPRPPRLGGGSEKGRFAKIFYGARSPAGFSTRSLAARALRTRHAGPEWNHLRNSRSARSPVLVIRANSQGATELVESLCHGTFRVEKGL